MKTLMKTFAISWVSSICVVAALAWPQTSSAQNIVFQTTFADAACPTKPGGPAGEHWRQSDYFGQAPGVVPCGGAQAGGGIIAPDGGWTANGFEDQITAAANYPNGGGGKGFRHWRANLQNVNGGGIRIEFLPGYNEVWGRFYMRYQLGFAWTNGRPLYTKDMYVNVGSPSAWVFGIQGGASWGIFNGTTASPGSLSWSQTMGGPTGDGLWHCYEWHIQHGPGARIEIWVDGAQVLNTTTTMPPGPTVGFVLGSNQHEPTGAAVTPWYTDYDDIAISNTGRIGCTLGTPVARPPAPQNLTVQ